MPRARGRDANQHKRSSGTQHEIVREGQVQHQRGRLPPQPEMQHDPESQSKTGQRSTHPASPVAPTRVRTGKS